MTHAVSICDACRQIFELTLRDMKILDQIWKESQGGGGKLQKHRLLMDFQFYFQVEFKRLCR